jgi:hypothetical protein
VIFWGPGKWRSRGGLRLEHESVTLACAAALVKKKIYRDLVDFDNHLDDITQVPLALTAAVLRIRDILVWIRILIRRSMPQINGSGSFYFQH